MKESESVKEYSNRLLSIANKVRLLGFVLNDSRIVEKLLVTVLEKCEATITTLENTKDLSKISLTKLLNGLQKQEQRRSMRQEGVIEVALPVKHQDNHRRKKEEVSKNSIYLATIVRRKVIYHTSAEEDLTPNVPNAINLDMKL
ncbi:uncharacterized protein LOC111433406 [Cucurbita moschata]|uniref:Uncharacterized protein LOC111433406 n=1 Tax=Cucurbita moschata TaxID=3662 RepID=A0A6J1EKI3_CUCMO|nr:uncharacterized protein LOC111433406 [Cucurbita moschata]